MTQALQLLENRYRIQSLLGRGSGGQVWKAIQLKTGQAVAIKLLSIDEVDAAADQRRIERFRREIAICSDLYHPEIVRLIDSGEADDSTYFAVFEYIPGRTLADLLREEGVLTLHRTCELLKQLLPPLAYAHSKGVAHRDLKPSNIMVTTDGVRDRVKVLDFGISLATGERYSSLPRLTLSNEWLGTPTYAAPEQLRGESVGPKSDIYAWGLIFVECLVGQPVQGGKSLVDVIERQMRKLELPAPLREHRLGSLLARVLERDPTRRPDDANLLLSMLERTSCDDLGDTSGYLNGGISDSPRAPSPLLSDTLIEHRKPALERRHLSVICCRVEVLGLREAMVRSSDEVVEDANLLVTQTLTQFGAGAIKSLGGFTAAYWGLVHARDVDARLAVRAALELAHRLERLMLPEPDLALRIRIGLHNGPINLELGADVRRPVDGANLRLAMALTAMGAEAVSESADTLILMSEEFRQLVQRSVEFQPWAGTGVGKWADGGAMQGVSRLLGESRAHAPQSRDSKFVGRGNEMAALLTAWHRQSNASGAVLVVGEPGVGKSRLALEFMNQVEEVPEWLEGRCLPEWQSAFLRPLSELIHHRFELRGLEFADVGERLASRLCSLGLDTVLAVPLFCGWLGYPLPSGYAYLQQSPQRQRQLLLRTIADALSAIMNGGVALLIEDIHWADPSTLECLELLLRCVRTNSTFVLLTARPSLNWSPSQELETIQLTGLADDAVAQLIADLLPGSVSDNAAVVALSQRSDGIPLYIEELAAVLRTRMPVPTATLPPPDAGLSASTRVPATLRDLLTSHLDGIHGARRTAEFAAALGREFSLHLLTTLSTQDEFALLGDLEELINAHLLVKRLRVDGPVYVFRHALIREAAYDGMSDDARRVTHGRIAAEMLASLPELAASQPDVLAHHFEHAGDADSAARYWLVAAKKSNAASAYAEGLGQLARGVFAIERLADDMRSASLEAELFLARGAALVATRGYADPEAQRSFERVSSLVPAEGDTLELAFAAQWGAWYYHNSRAELHRANEIASQLRGVAEGAGDSALSVSAWEAVCETDYCMGRLDLAVHAADRCEAEYDFEKHRHLALVRGDDPLLASLSFVAFAELLLGRPDQALARVQAGLQLAERLEFPSMMAAMHAQAAWTHLLLGGSGTSTPDVTLAREHAAIAKRLADEFGFLFWEVYAGMTDACSRILLGQHSTQELQILNGFWLAGGASIGRCWQLTFVAQGLCAEGSHEAALETLNEALAFCDERESRHFEPEVRATQADVLADASNPHRNIEAALDALSKARAAAEKMNAAWWLLGIAVRRMRIRPSPTRDDVAELAASVALFAASSTVPPVLREARTLLANFES